MRALSVGASGPIGTGDPARPGRGSQRHIDAVDHRFSSVGDLYDANSNGITAVRLFFLALAVLLFHAWPIGGFGPDPLTQLTGGRLAGGGELAVSAFFGLSGFLLVESRKRHSSSGFLKRRALRILPAYWAAIAATALLVGVWYIPAAWLPFAGVGSAAWAGWAAHPTPLINASLWSLWPEIICYVALAVLPARALPVGLAGACAALVVLAGVAPEAVFSAGVMFTPTMAFVSGALLAIGREHVPLAGPIALACAIAAFVTVGTMAGALIVAVACTYAAVWASVHVPIRWEVDLSYGVYILAFPAAQVLVSAGATVFGVWGLAALTAAATLPLATASWFLIERPALRYRPTWQGQDHLKWSESVRFRFGMPVQPAAATSEGRTTRAPSS